jgi:uncharacterized protein (TIGR03066 family)
MNAFRSLVAIALISMSSALAGAEEKNAKLLLGSWEVTKSGPGSLPEGTVVEFAAGGKMKLTLEVKGENLVLEATYSVKGDKFTITEKKGAEMRTQMVKIKKITDDQLLTENENGKEVELKRKK